MSQALILRQGTTLTPKMIRDTFVLEIRFCCLTFVDFDDEVDDVGFCIPNLFFSTQSTVEYLNNPLDDMGFNHRFATMYAPILKDQQVKIYKTHTEQGGVDTNRIYLVFPDDCNSGF